MQSQHEINYSRIEEAINYIKTNFKNQPRLEQVAHEMNLSSFHFQKLFTDWAGVSPKNFVQFLTIKYAKEVLRETQATLFEASIESGLSGTGRLHDLFIKIEGMTPGEFKNGGENLSINYSFAESPFGNIIVASTLKGICHIAFVDDQESALTELKVKFPNASYKQVVDLRQQNAMFIFTRDWNKLDEIKLHLKGTDFQIKIWETLLKIPSGQFTTYGKIANHLESPGASRAVGSAIGANPVAFLIPSHRIIQSTGIIGGYHWGSMRKAAMIGWEAAHIQKGMHHIRH